MIKISDIEMLNSLLKGYIKKGIYTNNFATPLSYKNDINSGNLYYTKTEAGVLLFNDRNSYWQCYYYLKNLNSPVDFPKDRAIILEKPYQETMDNSSEEMKYFESHGFLVTVTRDRMTASVLEFMKDPNLSHNLALANCTYAKKEHLNEINKLLQDNFDPYYGYIPLADEILLYINNQEILCELDNAGRLLGILHISKSHITYYVLHIVVKKEARNQQIGKRLLSQLYCLAKDNEKAKIQLWVNEGNESARNLYKSVGLKYDGWRSFVMIKNRL